MRRGYSVVRYDPLLCSFDTTGFQTYHSADSAKRAARKLAYANVLAGLKRFFTDKKGTSWYLPPDFEQTGKIVAVRKNREPHTVDARGVYDPEALVALDYYLEKGKPLKRR